MAAFAVKGHAAACSYGRCSLCGAAFGCCLPGGTVVMVVMLCTGSGNVVLLLWPGVDLCLVVCVVVLLLLYSHCAGDGQREAWLLSLHHMLSLGSRLLAESFFHFFFTSRFLFRRKRQASGLQTAIRDFVDGRTSSALFWSVLEDLGAIVRVVFLGPSRRTVSYMVGGFQTKL